MLEVVRAAVQVVGLLETQEEIFALLVAVEADRLLLLRGIVNRLSGSRSGLNIATAAKEHVAQAMSNGLVSIVRTEPTATPAAVEAIWPKRPVPPEEVAG